MAKSKKKMNKSVKAAAKKKPVRVVNNKTAKPVKASAAVKIAKGKKGSPIKKQTSIKAKVLHTVDSVVSQIQSLFSSEPKDIVQAVKMDHDALRNFIDILKDSHREMAERRQAFKLFSALLKSHSLAEEKAVYANAEKMSDRDLKTEIAEGFVEHSIADELLAQIERIDDPLTWGAHCNVLAEIIDHHIKEEEDELLPMMRKNMDSKTSDKMLEEFLKLRQASQTIVEEKNAGILRASMA